MRSQHRIILGLLAILPLLAPGAMGGVSAQEELLEPYAVTVGEMFTFTVETGLPSPAFSWVLERDGQTLEAQSQRFFRTVFPAAGTYDLRIAVRGATGEEETYRFLVHAEAEPSFLPTEPGALHAFLRTRPPADAAGVIRLPEHGGTLRLVAADSTGPVALYVIDLDAAKDTNGDGDPANDQDNAFHSSLQMGEAWQVSFRPAPGELQRSIRLTVHSGDGAVSAAEVTVLFDPLLMLQPRLGIFPAGPAPEGIVHVSPSGEIVRFTAETSLGDIRRYALDLDLRRDSDSDGIPLNDDDTAGTLFARDGSSLHVFLSPHGAEQERQIALTIVDADQRFERLEYGVVFGASEGISGRTEPDIISDTESMGVGTPFMLRVVHPPAGTVGYAWDFQSDDTEDARTADPAILLEPDAPGVLPVRVTLLDASGASLRVLSREFTVAPGTGGTLPPVTGDEGDPAARMSNLAIEAVMDGLTVSFAPALATMDLPRIAPTWNFGDGARSYLLTPKHTYAAPGEYTVVLTLRDAESGEDLAATERVITVAGAAVTPAASSTGSARTRSSFLGTVLSVLLFLAGACLLLGGSFLIAIGIRARRREQPFAQALKEIFQGTTGEAPLDASIVSARAPSASPRVEGGHLEFVTMPPVQAQKKGAEPAPSEEEVLPPWLKQSSAAPRPASPPPTPSSARGPVPPWLSKASGMAPSPAAPSMPPPRATPPPPPRAPATPPAAPAPKPAPMPPPPAPPAPRAAPAPLPTPKPLSPQAPTPPPLPPAPPPPAPKPPVTPPAPTPQTAAVPPWLQKGMDTPISPARTPPAMPPAPPAPSPNAPAKQPEEPKDTEPLAFIRADGVPPPPPPKASPPLPPAPPEPRKPDAPPPHAKPGTQAPSL